MCSCSATFIALERKYTNQMKTCRDGNSRNKSAQVFFFTTHHRSEWSAEFQSNKAIRYPRRNMRFRALNDGHKARGAVLPRTQQADEENKKHRGCSKVQNHKTEKTAYKCMLCSVGTRKCNMYGREAEKKSSPSSIQ